MYQLMKMFWYSINLHWQYIKLNNFFLQKSVQEIHMHACRLYNNKIVHLSRYLSQVKHMCHVKWLPAYLQFMVTINRLLKIINCFKQNLKIYIYNVIYNIIIIYNCWFEFLREWFYPYIIWGLNAWQS